MNLQEPPMPEHDKFRPHAKDASTIGEFIEWLHSKQVSFMTYGDITIDDVCPNRKHTEGGNRWNGDDQCINGVLWKTRYSTGEAFEKIGPCLRCEGEGYTHHKSEGWKRWGGTIEEVIAEYFGIDKKAFDAETEALYQVVSEAANDRNRSA